MSHSEGDIIEVTDEDDDIFDILGISIFATGGIWCTQSRYYKIRTVT